MHPADERREQGRLGFYRSGLEVETSLPPIVHWLELSHKPSQAAGICLQKSLVCKGKWFEE